MHYIKGKYRKSIFHSETGFTVGLFRCKETDLTEKTLVNKTITFTGLFPELSLDETYIFYGEYVNHERYGGQFQVREYEKAKPTGQEAIIEFLTSSFVKGCGSSTAKKIVDTLGDNAINLIKEDKNNLLACGVTLKTADKIYNSIISYYNQDEIIIYLKSLDFSVKEIMKILNICGNSTKKIVENDLYSLVDYVDFNQLDKAYFRIYDETNDMRKKACIIETMKRLTFNTGDIYSYKEEIINGVYSEFGISIEDKFNEYIEELKFQGNVYVTGNKYYLYNNYRDEVYISEALVDINNHDTCMTDKFTELINDVEKEFNITYNDKQRLAIKESLSNSLTIITGGPGVGKTTIINGILRMYQKINKLNDHEMNHVIALLAPTGRASKRMSEATTFGASTIHRYLKWNKETKEFGINEYNKNHHNLIIIDEVSMVDNELMASLLRGIDHNVKLVLVGDEYQLPPVGPGNALKDIIASDMFSYVVLDDIYRQSDNSYIPVLAKEIKNVSQDINLDTKKDDYNFIECDKSEIKSMLKTIILRSMSKGLTEKNMQILAPMYKGENGIDNLNALLQNLYNPPIKHLAEVQIGYVTYRIGDKVINLVNNLDANIFNGDIGYIVGIDKTNPKNFMLIDFYGNLVSLKREDVGTIRHAYAMSIHKSQGSEFDHIIIPLSKEYRRMLYNKLIYTGVSRAKRSLLLIGSKEAFMYAVGNSYSKERKTNLCSLIVNKYS